jgi:hypothetical protein
MQQLDVSAGSEVDLPRLRDVLDDALHELESPDREAVLLRYLEGRDLKSVGHALGLSDDAARKRVDRAIDKLHGVLVRRGIRSTHAALSAGLAALALATPPPGMSALITSTALAGSGTAATLLHQLMNAFQTKTAIAGVAVVAGLSTIVVHQHSVNQRLGRENEQLVERTSKLELVQTENQRLVVSRDEIDRLRKEHSELMRLRNQVTMLGRELGEATNALARAGKTVGTNLTEETVENPSPTLVRHAGKATVDVPAGQTLVMGGWPLEDGKKLMMFLTPEIVEPASVGAPAQIMVTAKLIATTGAAAPVPGVGNDVRTGPSVEVKGWSAVTTDVTLPVTGLLDQTQLEIVMKTAEQNGSRNFAAPRVVTFDGQQAQVSATRATRLGNNGDVVHIGPTLDVIPRISEGGVELDVAAEINLIEGRPLMPDASQ